MTLSNKLLLLLNKFLERYNVQLHRYGNTKTKYNESKTPYKENKFIRPKNLEHKLTRVKHGGPFEYTDMICRNKTIVGLLNDDKKIIELGGGTGIFAYEATKNPEISVISSELDTLTHQWAVENRSRKNIKYINNLNDFDHHCNYDVVVSVDVIEHIDDYSSFLKLCTQLAPRTILSTPDKNRCIKTATTSPPRYHDHVREWNAGEFYWVLRSFFKRVDLYGVFETENIGCIPISINDKCHALIADCTLPYRF